MSTEKVLLKAKALAKRGAVGEARALYASVLDRFPKNKRALEGMEALRNSASNKPPHSLLRELFALYQAGKHADLVPAAREAARVYPESIDILTLLATAEGGSGAFEDAVATYDRLLAIDPTNADALGNRGNAQKAAGDLEAALASFGAVLERRPGDPVALNNIGNIEVERGALEDAQAHFEQALGGHPDYGPALNNLGNVLKIRGRTKEAAAILSKAVASGSATAEAFWNLAAVTKFETGSPEIAAMEAARTEARLSESERMLVGFALGKAYEDAGDPARAFAVLSAANALRKAELGYEVGADIERLAAQKAVFASDVDVSTSARTGPIPIFIIGMPRSGTSLVEQMLSAHPRVHGGGEVELLNDRLSQLDWVSHDTFAREAPGIREDYLAHLTSLGGDAPYVTDKLPMNFMWVGAIRTLFPDAKIIHVKRDARATCWSNFKHYFSSHGNGFAYDLKDVVVFYLAYLDLMAHWQSAFPGVVFDLDYDEMTEDAERVMRALLSYLELPWDDACLTPEKNTRAVFTSSATQVRREIYQGSSRDWERFAPFIGDAFDALP